VLAAVVVVAVAATLVGVQVASGRTDTAAATGQSCSFANGIQHVIYLQFDNTHFNRDAPNVASDLEQMPHLLNFLEQNGTLFTNDHTILISHTAGGILSSLTGLYPDRQGQTVSNSYDFFKNNGLPQFTSSFKYWTSAVDGADDPLPNMVTDNQKTTPAPWVPFTRDGCDVGGVGTANVELENGSNAAGGDVANVFGVGAFSNETSAQRTTDFVGIAIHCSQAATSVCAGNANARPDPLPDEPGTYLGFNALYGAKFVDPAITGGNSCVPDTEGKPITDAAGNCGFPGFDGMEAHNTLGYVEQMQENGVPVTYGYISDAHDTHTPDPVADTFRSAATGPGEATHNQQLAAYDQAFADFFQNLAAHGIDRSNTLFVVTVDEGDHFAGGVGIPQPDGTLAYTHGICTDLANCATNQIGEVDANMNALLPADDQNPSGCSSAGTCKYDIHFDDAPTFYLAGQPSRTDPVTRRYEHDVAALTSLDPYVRDSAGNVQTVPLAQALADPVEEQTLHMVNSDPKRTPTFTMFGNPDFFFQLSNCAGHVECANSGFAWNHGDIQQEIGNTWVGFVGPGIADNGVDSTTWTDHTNLRPTILSLLGLKDDYTDDGHVLREALSGFAVPPAVKASGRFVQLSQYYEQVNASFGEFAMDTLKASTAALESTDDSTYTSIENTIASLTSQRDTLAAQMRSALNGAAFDGQAISNAQAGDMVSRAKSLLQQASALASSS
jgi:hypothetical protein